MGFILLNCEVRVDNVLIREVGTRLFCMLDADKLLREWTWKEATYKTLLGRGAVFANNPAISNESVGTTLLGEQDLRRRVRHHVLFTPVPGASVLDVNGDGDDAIPPLPGPMPLCRAAT